MQIVRYTSSFASQWDAFVTTSKNGTFLHLRPYMEYHQNRFDDCSLLFFENQTLLAILPANINKGRLISHGGLTYGGLVLSAKTTTPMVVNMFEALVTWCKTQQITQLIYKRIPSIYHTIPADEDLYALFLYKAQRIGCAVASVCDMNRLIPYSQLRKRGIKKGIALGIKVSQTDNLAPFWEILNTTLQERHHATPVHTLSEIQLLQSRFPQHIKCHIATLNNQVLGGCLVYETTTVAHAQYIAASTQGRESGALDILFDHLLSNTYRAKCYFDFGTSMQEDMLNIGLIAQKEGFGARAIAYETYQLTLS